MIPTRVEKLKFVVEEMQLAFHLAMHLTDPFVARTLARHILIRGENFIEHARGLRRPLLYLIPHRFDRTEKSIRRSLKGVGGLNRWPYQVCNRPFMNR